MLVVVAIHASAAASPDEDRAPGAVVVVVDRSMAADKLDAVSDALIDGLAGLEPGAELAVVTYAAKARVQVKLQPVKDGTTIAARLTGWETAGRANLGAGLRAAAGVLRRSKLTHKRVLVITDDDATLGVRSAVGKLRTAGITVSAVGLQSLNRLSIELIASAGGGRAAMIDDAAELGAVLAAQAQAASLAPPVPAAVVLVIDRSGSTGTSVLDAEKDLARIALEVLHDTDIVGVVAYDSEASVVVRPRRNIDRLRTADAISRIVAGGGTNMYPGLKEAFDLLKGISAEIKHVYLLSDGDGRPDGIIDLVQDMRAQRIGVSAIAMPGADSELLATIADHGDGHLLVAGDVADLVKLLDGTLGRTPHEP